MARGAAAVAVALLLGTSLAVVLTPGCGSTGGTQAGGPSPAVVAAPQDTPLDTWNQNLIRNPGAEASTGGTGEDRPVPRWTKHGQTTVVRYGVPGFPLMTSPGPPDRGRNFFCGGAVVPHVRSALDQWQDVSWAATQIDTKLTRCQFSAWIGGKGAEADSAQVILRFIDAGVSTLGEVTLGRAGPADRRNVTGLLYRERTVGVPGQTRYVWVFLRFSPGQDNYIHAFVDNVWVSLSPPT
jgi:hypothetical protein